MKSPRKKLRVSTEAEREPVARADYGTTGMVTRWLLPVLIVLLTTTAFLPTLQNGFVNWDDSSTLLRNPHYRGLGLSQLGWMFTTFHMGHYQPLSWMTLGLDYLLWGMAPRGYHLTSLFLHAANGVLFYFVTLGLLGMALSRRIVPGNNVLGAVAAFAALLFAIHPLRVESVAWASERRDVLSGFFFLWTIFCYLRAITVDRSDHGWSRWMTAAVIFYALSLLSKASAMTLPIVLLVLDVYPLGRLSGGPAKWFGPEARRVLWEKVPFLALGLIAGMIALFAQYEATALTPIGEYGVVPRVAQALFGLAFYLWKTVVPLSLSPLYPLPVAFNPWELRFLISGVVILAVSAYLYVVRRRWPALLAIWVCYIAILLPVLGAAQSGAQIAADRYTYLSCLGWAILAGGGLFHCGRAWLTGRAGQLTATGLATVVLLAFGVLTWKQVQVWHDSERLWRHALAVTKESSTPHYNLGVILAKRGEPEEAEEHYRRSIEINPRYADAHNNLGILLRKRGELEEAEGHYRQALKIHPPLAQTHFNLGIILAKRGELEEAEEHYRQALKINPAYAKVYYNLGILLAKRGEPEEAEKHFRQAIESNPGYADAHNDLGAILADQGKLEEAEGHYRQALAVSSGRSNAHIIHYNLGNVLARQGDLDKAVEHFQQVVHTHPEFAEAHENLGRALALQGKGDEAIKHYQEALRIMRSRREAPAVR